MGQQRERKDRAEEVKQEKGWRSEVGEEEPLWAV